MAKMSDYPSVENTDEFTPEQKAAFLGSAMCIATGSKTDGGSKVTANIPLSDITPAVPTKLSDLTDDITQQTVGANDTRPVSGAAVSSAMASFGGFQVATKGQDGKPVGEGTIDQKKIYLTSTGESGTENAYDEWICTDTSVPTWEKVGVTRVNLSQYYTKTEVDSAFVSKTGYVATDNNYTTTEKNKLDGIETGAQVNVQPDWNATAGSAAEILNKPAIPSSGYTRVTRNATINNDEFVVPVNNRESVTAILTRGSSTTDTVKLELSNDCDDAIVFLDGSAAYEGISGVDCYRGNTQLRVILPIQRELQDVDYLLQSTNYSGSGRAVPSSWNEVGLVSASYADRYDYEKLYPHNISRDGVRNLLVRIVADYAFVHYVDLPND